jgi:hypothetical protein
VTVYVVLAICGLVFLILARPFRQAPPPSADRAAPPATPLTPTLSPPSDSDERTRLLDEKDRLFQALADLRFDYEAGKLSPEDFELEDTRLRVRAAAALKALEC